MPETTLAPSAERQPGDTGTDLAPGVRVRVTGRHSQTTLRADTGRIVRELNASRHLCEQRPSRYFVVRLDVPADYRCGPAHYDLPELIVDEHELEVLA